MIGRRFGRAQSSPRQTDTIDLDAQGEQAGDVRDSGATLNHRSTARYPCRRSPNSRIFEKYLSHLSHAMTCHDR
jgi:hypothetical protein